MLLKIIVFIVVLPLFLEGLSLVFQLVLGGSLGGLALFGCIWDKEQPLSAKQGLLFGVVSVVFLIAYIFFIYVVSSFIPEGLYSFLLTVLFVISHGLYVFPFLALIRGKFSFAFASFFSYSIGLVILEDVGRSFIS